VTDGEPRGRRAAAPGGYVSVRWSMNPGQVPNGAAEPRAVSATDQPCPRQRRGPALALHTAICLQGNSTNHPALHAQRRFRRQHRQASAPEPLPLRKGALTILPRRRAREARTTPSLNAAARLAAALGCLVFMSLFEDGEATHGE